MYLERMLRVDGDNALKRPYSDLGCSTGNTNYCERGILVARMADNEYKFIITTISDNMITYDTFAVVDGKGTLLRAGMKWDRWGQVRELRNQHTLDDLYEGVIQAITFAGGADHFWDKKL